MKNNKNIIKKYLRESVDVIKSLSKFEQKIQTLSTIIHKKIKTNKNIFVTGNGGSLADAMHFVTELNCTFINKKRKPIKSFVLGDSVVSMSAWSNDFNYETFQSRILEGVGEKGDLLIVLSTSGGNLKSKQSMNLINFCKLAKKKNIYVAALLGRDGGVVKKNTNFNLILENKNTAQIQEGHMTILHLLCQILEKQKI